MADRLAERFSSGLPEEFRLGLGALLRFIDTCDHDHCAFFNRGDLYALLHDGDLIAEVANNDREMSARLNLADTVIDTCLLLGLAQERQESSRPQLAFPRRDQALGILLRRPAFGYS